MPGSRQIIERGVLVSGMARGRLDHVRGSRLKLRHRVRNSSLDPPGTSAGAGAAATDEARYENESPGLGRAWALVQRVTYVRARPTFRRRSAQSTGRASALQFSARRRRPSACPVGRGRPRFGQKRPHGRSGRSTIGQIRAVLAVCAWHVVCVGAGAIVSRRTGFRARHASQPTTFEGRSRRLPRRIRP